MIQNSLKFWNIYAKLRLNITFSVRFSPSLFMRIFMMRTVFPANISFDRKIPLNENSVWSSKHPISASFTLNKDEVMFGRTTGLKEFKKWIKSNEKATESELLLFIRQNQL